MTESMTPPLELGTTVHDAAVVACEGGNGTCDGLTDPVTGGTMVPKPLFGIRVGGTVVADDDL
jgi:hypothetical protein